MLGLERLLAEEEPHLADGTTLSAHQVDALSGTLIALEAELLIGRNGKGSAGMEELHSGEVEIEGDELPDEEPLDWDPAEEAEEEAAADARRRGPGRRAPLLVRARHGRRQDRRRARLRRGLAHGRHPDPHPPPQPGGPVPRRAARPRLQEAHLGSAAEERRRRAAGRRTGHGRDLPVVRAQRRQGLGRVHDRHLRRGPHRARREDERLDPPVDRPGLRGHDGHRRADRAARDRPLPDADLALRPRAGRPARRDRAAALACGSRRAWACARSRTCRCAAARWTRTSTRKSWPRCSTRRRSTWRSPTSTRRASRTCRGSCTPRA